MLAEFPPFDGTIFFFYLLAPAVIASILVDFGLHRAGVRHEDAGNWIQNLTKHFDLATR